jgi:hypothetical protein
MNDAELDRILSQSERIVPSDDFVGSVMHAVERERAPSALPFPWLRALPIIAALIVSIGAILIVAIRALIATSASSTHEPSIGVAFAVTQSYATGWVVVGLGVALVSMLVPLRFIGSRASAPF